MSDIFPKWTNRLPLYIIIGALLIGTGVTAGVWYYFTPKYTRVGYQPIQPVGFPHSVHVHKVPDYVYFNHSVHVNRGISCVHCHGEINKMEEVYHAKPLSMTFCLDCHRNPAPNLRPKAYITQLDWNPLEHLPADWGKKAVKEWNVNASQNC